MTVIDFDHRQTAHCESGAMSALLRHNGLDISEPMVFGIANALTFAYLPLVKIGGMPMIAYRMPPGRLIKGVASRLGFTMEFERFRNAEQGMHALNRHLDQGRPVGLQASVYWLPYFPQDMRFHFNAHNLVAYGYEDEKYLLSDPTFEHPVSSDYQALKKARFVKGMLAPKGLIYYPTKTPENPDLPQAIRKAIKGSVNMMLRTPLPIIGVSGIRYVAKKFRAMGNAHEQHEGHNKLVIGHMVRMQEEIGTGGAGFRFLYASFLQEAAGILDCPKLEAASQQFTDTGDEWRRFALFSAKMLKGRIPLDYDKLADQLLVIADSEANSFRQLQQAM